MVKDEIKKGSFSLSIGDGANYEAPFSTKVTIADTSSAENFRNNSPAGEYGFLKYVTRAATATLTTDSAPVDGQTLIIKKSDGATDHTMTVSAAASSATVISHNDGVPGNADDLAAAIKATLDAAAADGQDLSHITVSALDGRTVTLTQETPGAAGNTVIAGTLISANKILVNSSGGSGGTQAFIKGLDADTVGLLYYQAGIAALTSSMFGDTTQVLNHATCSHSEVMKKNTIPAIADGIRHRIDNLTFSNVTELNSTIYFCRINHNEFNYSSNPTYLEDSKIVVKNDPGVVNQAGLSPITYITTVGLYSTNNELMAVAKLSEPLKKTPDNEFTLRVRLDY